MKRSGGQFSGDLEQIRSLSDPRQPSARLRGRQLHQQPRVQLWPLQVDQLVLEIAQPVRGESLLARFQILVPAQSGKEASDREPIQNIK